MHLEVNDSGVVILPAELVQAAPHTCLEAERQGNAVILRFPDPPLAMERARTLLDLPVIPTRPVDETMTFRRETLYGNDDR
ncbi:MAG: hypothetical protein JO028_01520 [Acidobacteriaceae bacterium]|nr:hypothetical protein [Acidobacteriaceae bacterium]